MACLCDFFFIRSCFENSISLGALLLTCRHMLSCGVKERPALFPDAQGAEGDERPGDDRGDRCTGEGPTAETVPERDDRRSDDEVEEEDGDDHVVVADPTSRRSSFVLMTSTSVTSMPVTCMLATPMASVPWRRLLHGANTNNSIEHLEMVCLHVRPCGTRPDPAGRC